MHATECLNIPIKVFKLLMIVGDLEGGGGYKLLSFRYTNTKGVCLFFFFQAEDGIRDSVASRGLGDVYKRQINMH